MAQCGPTNYIRYELDKAAAKEKSIKVAFLGGMRYSQPLDAVTSKKFEALTNLGELFVIGFSYDLRPRRFNEDARFYLFPNFPFPHLRYAAMFTAGPIVALWLIFRHKVRILVAQSPYEGFAAGVAKTVASWFGKRVALVVESHGDFEISLFLQRRLLFPGIYKFFMRGAARFALNKADTLRAISTSTTDQLERWAPGKRVHRFATWTDIELFIQAGANRPVQSSQEIIYVGVLTPLKGVHHLLNAFAAVAQEFPEAHLTVIGREENREYAAELRSQASSLKLGEHVQFMAEMSQKELSEKMSRACVCVLPSYSEGLGRVLIEALATGTPVIGSAVGGIPDIVQNEATGFLVPPGDEAALAARLLWFLKNPEEGCEMGQKARAFAVHTFSTESYVHGYAELFRDAALEMSKS